MFLLERLYPDPEKPMRLGKKNNQLSDRASNFQVIQFPTLWWEVLIHSQSTCSNRFFPWFRYPNKRAWQKVTTRSLFWVSQAERMGDQKSMDRLYNLGESFWILNWLWQFFFVMLDEDPLTVTWDYLEFWGFHLSVVCEAQLYNS